MFYSWPLPELNEVFTLYQRFVLVMEQESGSAGWLEPCKWVREKRISAATGGYCQARQKLPTLVVQQVSEEIQQRLRNQLGPAWRGLEQPGVCGGWLFAGLAHTPELVKAFPPAENQHGTAHWPVLRIVVVHDLSSGMAERPCWGAMYGKKRSASKSWPNRPSRECRKVRW